MRAPVGRFFQIGIGHLRAGRGAQAGNPVRICGGMVAGMLQGTSPSRLF
jgi:hypothetical protein